MGRVPLEKMTPEEIADAIDAGKMWAEYLEFGPEED